MKKLTNKEQKDQAYEAYQAIKVPAREAYQAIEAQAWEAYQAKCKEIDEQEHIII